MLGTKLFFHFLRNFELVFPAVKKSILHLILLWSLALAKMAKTKKQPVFKMANEKVLVSARRLETRIENLHLSTNKEQ